MTNTVKVRITIEIRSNNVHDTGMTVEQWNALDDRTREHHVKGMWDLDAGNDDKGGITITPGNAEGVR